MGMDDKMQNKAEEMAGKQDMAGRRHRNELGQPLQQAEQQGFDDGLAFHGYLGIGVTADRTACLSWRASPPIGRNTLTAR